MQAALIIPPVNDAIPSQIPLASSPFSIFSGIPGINNRAIKKTNICVNNAIMPHTKQLINVEECAIIIAIGRENPIKLPEKAIVADELFSLMSLISA